MNKNIAYCFKGISTCTVIESRVDYTVLYLNRLLGFKYCCQCRYCESTEEKKRKTSYAFSDLVYSCVKRREEVYDINAYFTSIAGGRTRDQ